MVVQVNTDQALTALVDRIADIKSGSRCSLIASLLQLLRGSCWKLYHADGSTDAVSTSQCLCSSLCL